MTAPEEGDPLERIAEEFLDRVRKGEAPSIEEYARRHPLLADEIRRHLATVAAMDRLAAEGAEVPRQIGPYRVRKEIGRGGMGAVYLAEDVRLGRRVALKILGSEFAPFVLFQQRFGREAAAAARLDHPGICTVYEAGTADGVDYIAMRFVEGRNLAALLEEARATGTLALPAPAGMSPRTRLEETMRAVFLVERCARALHTAHEAGLVHRDIKPGNVMVTPEGDPVILDFGLVASDEDGGDRLTRSGMRLGTPAYMSPEQVSAEKARLDRRTDVYSLGVTLYEALTLRLPYEAPTLEGLYRKILSTDPESPRRLNRELPKDLVVVVETAMEKERHRRYQSALDLAEELRRVREHEPILAKPAGPVVRTRRWAERNPGTAAACGALVLSLAGGLGVSLHLLGTARAERDAKGKALVEKGQALDQKEVALRRARSLGLVNASEAVRTKAPARALLLAREAVRTEPLPEAIGQLHAALASSLERARCVGHEGPLTMACFSRAGDRVLTASEDKTARLFDLAGKELVVFRGHTERVSGAVFSPSGDRVLTSSWDGTARLFDLEGRETAVFRGAGDAAADPKSSAPAGAIWTARFSPSGDAVLTASNDGTARLFDLEGHERVVFRGHGGVVWSAVFSAAGDRVLTACGDRTARLFDLEGREVAAFRGHEGAVRSAVFSPGGDAVLTASEDGWPRLFDLAGRERALFKGGHKGAATSAAFSPSGDRVVTASWDLSARLFDLEGKELAAFLGHENRVTAAVFSPSGDRVLTASWDKTARVYDLAGRERAVLRGHEGPLRSIAWSPAGDLVLTSCWDRRARLFDPAGTEITDFRSHEGPVWSAVYSPSGDRVLTCSFDRTARLHDLSGREIAVCRGHEFKVWSAVFSPSGDRVLTASDDETARLFELDGREAAVFRGHEGPVFTARFSASGDRVVTASQDRTARVWDLSGKELARIQGHRKPVRSAALSPAGDRVLTASEDGTARLFDLEGRELAVFQGHTGWVCSAIFSAAGDRVLTAGEDGTARLYDLEGRELAAYRKSEGALWSAVFSPSGDRVLTACEDRAARIFDVAGPLLAVIRGHEGPVRSAVFSPSGDRVLTASMDGTARLWFVDPGEVLRLADARVVREFSPSALEKYADLLGR